MRHPHEGGPSFAADMPYVVADRTGYRIGTKALLDDVSLRFDAGSVVAMIGPNGAGKSTMLGLIAGDLEPTSGHLLVGGRPPRDWRANDIARHRAVMSQQHEAVFAFTVRELVAMGRVPHDASESDDKIVDEAIRSADLLQLSGRESTTLSGGELSRTVFARVLAQTGKLVLLDEPTAAMDLRHQELVMRVAAGLAAAGACVVVVLHDLNLAARYADRVAMFSEGSLVADGLPGEVLTAERISEVYQQQVRLLRHPDYGHPLVVPV